MVTMPSFPVAGQPCRIRPLLAWWVPAHEQTKPLLVGRGQAQPDTSQQFASSAQEKEEPQKVAPAQPLVLTAVRCLSRWPRASTSPSACRLPVSVPLPRSCSDGGGVCLQLVPSPWAGEFASIIKQRSAAGGWETCRSWSIPLETSNPCPCALEPVPLLSSASDRGRISALSIWDFLQGRSELGTEDRSRGHLPGAHSVVPWAFSLWK